MTNKKTIIKHYSKFKVDPLKLADKARVAVAARVGRKVAKLKNCWLNKQKC